MEDIFNDIKRQGISFLSQIDVNYQFQKEEYKKYNTYDKYSVIFDLINTNQYFEISLNYFDDGKIDISLLLDNINYNYSIIYITDYMTKYSKNKNAKLLWYDKIILKKNKGNNISEKLASFLNWFLEIMDDELISIFRGEKWIEIPFDWGDYK